MTSIWRVPGGPAAPWAEPEGWAAAVLHQCCWGEWGWGQQLPNVSILSLLSNTFFCIYKINGWFIILRSKSWIPIKYIQQKLRGEYDLPVISGEFHGYSYLSKGIRKVKWKQLLGALWATHSRGNSRSWKKRTCLSAQRYLHTQQQRSTHTYDVRNWTYWGYFVYLWMSTCRRTI